MIPPAIAHIVRILAADGMTQQNYMEMPGTCWGIQPSWLLPPLVGVPVNEHGLSCRTEFVSELDAEQALSLVGAYRFMIRDGNPGVTILQNFREQGHKGMRDLISLYVTPSSQTDVEMGWPVAAVAAVEIATALYEMFYSPLEHNSSTYCAEAYGHVVGVIDGKVVGTDIEITSDALSRLLRSDRTLPWQDVNPSIVKLRNLLGFRPQLPNFAYQDALIALYGSIVAPNWQGAYQPNPGPEWTLKTATLQTDVLLQFKPIRPPSKTEIAREAKWYELQQRKGRLAEAVDVLLSEIPDLTKVRTMYTILVPNVVSSTYFNDKILAFTKGDSSFVIKHTDNIRATRQMEILQMQNRQEILEFQRNTK